MALKFKYNKTALQELTRAMKVRVNALPTLKSKEAALRLEVSKAKELVEKYQNLMEQQLSDMEPMMRLWGEFDFSLVRIKNVTYTTKVIAGVKTPVVDRVEFDLKDTNLYLFPSWFPSGTRIFEELARLIVQKEAAARKVLLLEQARKKTTQKVNLYEKVQIPEYQEAIRKIKRFLEDEENLAKAAQKILKKRKETVTPTS